MKISKTGLIVAVSALTLGACVSVRQADLDAWQGVPVIELESHPIFNAMELEKKPLSDGSTMWSFTKHGGTYQNCSASSQASGTSVTQEKTRTNTYDRYGYDPYGYDRYGYDRHGYDRRGYNKQGVKRKTEVTTTNDTTYSNSNCVSGEYICVNQFLVNKEGIVQWYHPTGNNCYTNCSYRPHSRPCPR